MAERLARITSVVGTSVAVMAFAWAAFAEAPGLKLGLPVDCKPGRDCWVSEYIDHDPSPNGRDYRCGPLADDKHGGTDIAIAHLGRMRSGVGVVAAAAGTVKGTRDGMQDISVAETGVEAVKNQSCGNGVVLDHGDGWVTQYCHMKFGSIAVKKGDTVAAGQEIGKIGLSGMTQHPHLHFEARHNGDRIDPFNGQKVGATCDAPVTPLWREAALQALKYLPVTLYNVGLIEAPPSAGSIRNGDAHRETLATSAPALVLWVDSFGVAKNDEIHFRIIGPDDSVVFEHTKTLEKKYARWYGYSGRKLRGAAWQAGTYRGEVTVTRKAGGETLTDVIATSVVIK